MAPFFCLVGSHVLQPFGIEGGCIHIEAGCGGKNLCIACPAQSLIPLGTIGGHIQEVSL